MATILAHITVRAGQEERFEELARQLYKATHASESGVRAYEYWRGQAPGSYYALLAFEDHRSFVEHQTSGHHDEAGTGLREVIDHLHLEWVDPVAEASELPPTGHQPAPESAGSSVREVTDRFAAEVADWWGDRR